MPGKSKYNEPIHRTSMCLPESLWRKLYSVRLSKKYGEKRIQDIMVEAIEEWFAKRDEE